MPRDGAPRFVLALAALLVTLQFIGMTVPTVSSALATSSSASASQEPSTHVALTDDADEFTTCGKDGQIANRASWAAGRDRRRATATPSVGGLRAYEFNAPCPGVLAASHAASGSSGNPSLASLQVFRC
ncbi:hypothetical protein [Streptomyces sp. NPDC096311]|uniref:hypothetical protein n=1 Tax=Streptomyces sp. NPDC096311 TaxID=3366083 RepID=UPI003810371A